MKFDFLSKYKFGGKGIPGSRRQSVTAFQLWDEYLANHRGKDLSMSGVVKPHAMYADFVALYSGEDTVTYLYVIDKFSRELPVTYKRDLRSVRHGDVRISFIDDLEYHKIRWDSAEIKNRLASWQSVDRDLEKKKDTGNSYDVRDSLSMTDLKRIRQLSAQYFSEATTRRERMTYKVRSLIVVTGTRGHAFDKTVHDLNLRMSDMGISTTRLLGDMSSYLRMFMPTSRGASAKERDEVSRGMVLTDEILARMVTFAHGNTSQGDVYFGTDVYTGLAVAKSPKKDLTAAENWLVSAETGGGKSYMIKMLLFQLLAKNNHVATIMDIEGDEYLPLAYFIGSESQVVVLNIGEGSGNYFDPVEVILSGNAEEDKQMLTFSVSYTKTIFRTLLTNELAGENIHWIRVFIETGVNDFYASLGVKENDMSTWGNTGGKTLFDVFDYICNHTKISNTDAKMEFELMETVLRGHFRRDGFSTTFTNRITFDKIRDAKIVLCDFGMKGRSESTVDPISMALMQLYTAFISHLRSIFSFNKGNVNVKVWEEFQRWGTFPDADKTIKTPLTGGRKLGDINIIVTNQPSRLLNGDTFGIFETITTYALGATADSAVREGLAKRLGVDETAQEFMQLELDKINKNRDVESEARATKNEGGASEAYQGIMKNKFSKSFLVSLNRTSMYITKVVVPEHVSTSPIFRTGVDDSAAKANSKSRSE